VNGLVTKRLLQARLQRSKTILDKGCNRQLRATELTSLMMVEDASSKQVLEISGEPTFGERLEGWLGADGPKTLGGLDDLFKEKGFVVLILFLMSIPALPLPTGGITHVFEAITVLLGVQMVLGIKRVWLPKRWRDRELGETVTTKALPFIARRIEWFEKRSRPRGRWLIANAWFMRLVGAILIIFAVAAGFAPPFSGLDTLPALGAVILCLGVILGDLLIAAVGVVVGIGGVTLILTIGAALVKAAKSAIG
jgi:hypothetical protein